jgi:hypothetical protein
MGRIAWHGVVVDEIMEILHEVEEQLLENELKFRCLVCDFLFFLSLEYGL